MTKEEREFIVKGILGMGISHCDRCPLKPRCTDIHSNTCYSLWNKYLSVQYPEPKDEKLTLKMLVDVLQGFMDQSREIAYKIIDHTNIQREANYMGIVIKENEVSKVLIKLNYIDESIGINTKSIQDIIREVTRDRLAKGFVDSIKEGNNV
jgi:hypothetical protein